MAVLLLVLTAGLTISEYSSAATSWPEIDVQEIVLANGFRLLVVEDHRVPRVAASLWYQLGAVQEPSGAHGEIHFLEHVLHQGTTTIGTTNFEAERPILRSIQETEQKLLEAQNRERNHLRAREVFYDPLDWPTTPEIEELRRQLYALEDEDTQYRKFWAEWLYYAQYGATKAHGDPVPATTGYERMEIDVDLPKENIELLFRLEADRMVNAVLRGWEAQRYTVLEQLLNRHSRPETNLYFAVDGVKGWGHLRDFAFFNRVSMLRMYDQYMVPGNTTLVLVGDIDLAHANSLAERYFGRIPASDPVPVRMELEAIPVPQTMTRLNWAESLEPRIIVRYRIPGVGHPDRPVMDTIAALLKGRHGMIGKGLIGEGDAITGFDVTDQLIHTYKLSSPGAIDIVIHARSEDMLPDIERSILSTINRLRTGHVDSDALSRARKALKLEWHRIRSARRSLAYELGTFQVMDSWKTLQPYMEARTNVSVKEIQRVAATYFVPSNLTIATSRRNPITGTDPRLEK